MKSMSSTASNSKPIQRLVTSTPNAPIVLNDYETLSTNCTMVGSNNLPLDTSPKKVTIANNGFIRSGNTTFRLQSPCANLTQMSFGSGTSDLNASQLQKVIVNGGSAMVTGNNVTSVGTIATSHSPSTIFQSIPTVIAAANNSTTPNLVQIIQAPSNNNQTYQTHQILTRPAFVGSTANSTPIIKLKSPLNILPKPASVMTTMPLTTTSANQIKTPSNTNINHNQPMHQQGTSIILTNQGAHQTIIPSSGGTFLLNQLPLILQQNGGTGVQFVLKPNANNQPQIITSQAPNIVNNKMTTMYPNSNSANAQTQLNQAQTHQPQTVLIQQPQNNQQQTSSSTQQPAGSSQPQPQQVVRLVGNNGVMQQLATPTFIAVNNTTINNNLTTINKNASNSEPQTPKGKQKQSSAKKKKKSASVFKETKLDLANIMKLSGIGDDDGFLDSYETEKLSDHQVPIKPEATATNNATTTNTNSTTHINPPNIVFDSNQMSQPTTIIDPNNGTLLNVLQNNNYTIQNGFITQSPKPITSQQIVINPSPILTFNNVVPSNSNNQSATTTTVQSRPNPSGGYKLLLNEDGRFVLQHDPNLNQDLQSQLFLQNLFGNLNSGANNPLLQSLLNNIQQLQQNQKVVTSPQTVQTPISSLIQNITVPSQPQLQPQPQPPVSITPQTPPTKKSQPLLASTSTLTPSVTSAPKKSPYILSLTLEQLDVLKKDGQLVVNGQTIYMQASSTSTVTATTTATTTTTTTTEVTKPITTPSVVTKSRKKSVAESKKACAMKTGSVTKGPILHTIQITTAQEQMLKSIQAQIDSLNDRLRKDAKVTGNDKESLTVTLKQLYAEQQKILASGKVIDSNNGCTSETFTAALNNLQNSKICFQNSGHVEPLVLQKEVPKSKKALSADVIVKAEVKEEPVSLFDLVKASDVRSLEVDRCATVKQTHPAIEKLQSSAIPHNSTDEIETPVPPLLPLLQQTQLPPSSVSQPPKPPNNVSSNSVSSRPLFAQQPIIVPDETEPEIRSQKVKSNPAEIAQKVEDKFLLDQQSCVKGDYMTPFQSKQDAIERLMRYHCFDQPVLSQKHLDKADEIFDMTALHFFNKHHSMLNKYRYLLLNASTKEVPTSELMMIGRLLNAEEQQCLNRERLEAEQRKNDEEHAKIYAQQSSTIDQGFRVECDKKRIRLDIIEKMETSEDPEGDDHNCIDEQVQSAIDSILNLQQKPSTPVQCNDDQTSSVCDSKPESGSLFRQQHNNNNSNSLRKKVVSMHIVDNKAMDEAVRSILS